MPDADTPGLCHRQELQDDIDDGDEEVQPPMGPDDRDVPGIPSLCEGYDNELDDGDCADPMSDCHEHFEAFRASQLSASKPTVAFAKILNQLDVEDEDDSKPSVAHVVTHCICEAYRMHISLKRKNEQLKGINKNVLEAEYNTVKHIPKKGTNYKPGWIFYPRRMNYSAILLK
jgi:hypothetical protein